jgi:hypothetical protein
MKKTEDEILKNSLASDEPFYLSRNYCLTDLDRAIIGRALNGRIWMNLEKEVQQIIKKLKWTESFSAKILN